MDEAGKNSFPRLLDIIERLRRDCPWDRAQTIESLAPLLLDECYEVKEAIRTGDLEGTKEELGDVLILLLMMAEIASQEGKFNLKQVIECSMDKLQRRHPHVFAGQEVESPDRAVELWAEIKTGEKGGSILKGIPKGLPALRKAHLLQQRASSVGFDWENLEGVLEKLGEELEELEKAKSKGEIENELGDVFFILANLGNKLGIDPEEALSKVCEKFIERFTKVEETLRRQGKDPKDATLEEMDEIWEKTKRGGE